MGNCFVPKKRFNNPYLVSTTYLTPARGSIRFNHNHNPNFGGVCYLNYGRVRFQNSYGSFLCLYRMKFLKLYNIFTILGSNQRKSSFKFF